MKLLLLLLAVFILTSGIKAQVLSGKSADNLITGSQTIRLNEKTKTISYLKLEDDYLVSVSDHKSWLSKALNFDEKYSLRLIKQESDNLGYMHYRYQVMYENYPIEGYVYYVHTKNNRVISVNGDFSKAKGAIVSTSLTAKDAFQKAIQYFGAEKYKWENEKSAEKPEGNLIFIPLNGVYKFVYKFDIYSIKPLRKEFVYVDASNGKILKTVNQIQTSNTTGTAITKYNGTRQITADSYSGSYRLKEYGNRGQGIETYDLNTSTNTSSAVDFTDSDNYWNTTTNQDNAAYDAHFGTEATWDYYYNKFGRNSIDGSGFMLKSYVHYDLNYVNAFWDGQVMTYGDGDGIDYTALTSIDIVAHEISHGLTQFSANLEYSSESGALNESFSDIFGVAVDFYVNPTTANWLMGDMISTTGSSFRNMSNPNQFQNPDTYLGQYWDTYEEVHCNSGVQNYWYYLLSIGGSGVNDIGNTFSVTGIGMDKAAQIAFRTLTVYLSQYSNYADARAYSIQAATDLYGACSAEVIATTNAWYAVGVGSVFSNAVLADFSTPQIYYCTTPATVNFTSTSVNSTGFAWNFGDGTTSTVNNPSHTYSTSGAYSVQLITTGSASCGSTSDTMLKTNFITVSNTGGPGTATCSPSTVNSTGQYGITNFTFNTINKSSAGSTDGYKNYTCSNSTTVSEGLLYNFSVTNESTYNSSLKIWLDVNNDGQFNNTNELLYNNSNALQYTTGNLLIPAGATFNVPLRLRIASDMSGTYLSTSCTNSQYGQYEDYSVIIQQNMAAPDADFTANNTTVNLGQTVTFTDQSLNVPTSWQWTFYGGTPSTSSAQNPSVVYNTIGTYNVKLKATNSYGTDSIIKSAYIHVVNSYNMCATTTTTSQNGVLYDSGGPSGSYMNSENCSFLIDINCASSITLSFSSFQTEGGYDYVRVYDGANSSGIQLLNYAGSSIPSPVIAHSGKMFIQFTTDGSVTYSGFAASWASVVPSGTPPIGNFNISNTNPPLNSPVIFTDLSTNVPIGWNWNFGDGGTSILQNPSHSYAAPGTYNVTLVVNNCFSSNTIIKSLVVQSAPSISVTPSSINATITGCNDSTIVPLTITNSGSGALIYDITTSNSGSGGPNIIFDNFEDGNYNGWTVGSNHTATVTTSSPANGSKCLSLSGGGTSFTGLYRNFTSATPTYISAYIKQGTSSCANYFIVGDDNIQSNYGIIYMYFYNSYIYIYNGSSSVSTPYVTNQWYHIEFKNINYTTKKFDVYINGTLFQANLTFHTSTSTFITKIHMYNYYTGTTYYDDISIGDNPSTNSWITALPDSGIVSAGSSSVVNIKLNAHGLLSGTYTSQVTINNNDPVHPAIIVPCTFTLAGSPVITLSDTCLNYGSIIQYTNKSDTLRILNTGCDTLHITNVTSTAGEFTATPFQLNVAPFDTGKIFVIFHPSSIGSYNGTLNISSNAGNKTVCLSGVATGAPIISVHPNAFNVTINSCNDSITLPLTINNTGSGNLNYTIEGGGGASGTLQVLAFTNGVDYDEEYNHTIAAINQYFTNYNLTEINTTSASTLQAALTGKQVLIIPEQEEQTNPSIFTSFASILQTFVNNGGTVIFCGVSTSNSSCIFNTGLFSGSYVSTSSSTLNVTNTSHPLTTGVPSTITSPNATLYCNFTNSDKVRLVNYNNTYDVVSYRLLGSGKIIYIGFDYYAYDNNSARIIANAVEWGGIGGSSWLHTSNTSGTVAIGDSAIIDVTFCSAGLSSGVYTADFTISHNDPTHQQITIPCTLTVNGTPNISVTDSCLYFGTIVQYTTKKDSLYIHNTGCDTLHVTSISSSSAAYTSSATILNIAPNDSAKVVVTFSPTTVGSISGNLYLYNNDITKIICLNGNATGAPHILFNPASYNVTITSCNDSVTYPLQIHNTGLSPLTWTYQQPMANVSDDFDPGIDYTIWQSIVSGTATNTCGYFSAPNSLYFNGATREAITKPINTTSGGNIRFYLQISSSSAPCEMADAGEDIVLSYSINNGSTWTNIQTFYTGSYNSFTQINVSIPVAARTAATMFKWSQPTNSGSGYDNWSIDNVSITSSLSGGFVHVLTNSGTVNSGDSVTIYVRFSSHDLNAGIYTNIITFNTNDPQHPQATLPCTLTVVGTSDIALSQPCLNYGTVIQYTQNRDTLLIFNHGCSTLNISNIVSSSGAFTVNTTTAAIAPNDTGFVIVTFTPPTMGTFSGNLYIYNNDNDTLICLSGIAQSAPVIGVSPTSFNVTLNACGNSTTLPLNISNTGGSNLNYTIGGGGTSGNIQVLAFTNGVDYDEEYNHTIAAINQYFTSYNLTEINTTSASALQTALVGKHVLLIPEQEEQTNQSIFTSFASVLQTFVNNGGTVIFCGVSNTNSSCIFNTGLFSGSYISYTTSTLNVTNTSHPLTTGVPSTITAQSATMYCNFTNSDKVRLVNYSNTYDVVSYRLVGSGKTIYVGFDFFAYDNNSARIIANAVQWGGENAMASWVSLSSAAGSVNPGNTQTINVTFSSDGLPGGTYTSNITVNSNDPVNSQILIPCTLHVTYNPCVAFGYTLSSCNGNVSFTDSTINTPTSWHWNFGDGTTSNLHNPTHTYTSTGSFNVELIACNSYGCDTLIRTILISSLSGPVTASCAPVTTGNCCGMGILNVTFNTINNTTGDGLMGYQNYTCTQGTNVIVAHTYTLTIQTGTSYAENVGAWIDYNNNGTFETTEKVLTSSNSYTHSVSVSIPSSAVLNTPLRMRIGSDYYSNPAPGSCTNVTYGQFEDYSVVIQPDNQPPIANFTVNVLDNCQGIVQFVNQSLNSPTSVLWNFGDGSSSTTLSPYHAYAIAGNYQVTLTATNAFGSDAFTYAVSIHSLTASFTADSILYAGSFVYFHSVSTSATSFNWDFGDGYSASIQNPIHVYMSPGTYNVTLISSNAYGCSVTSSQSIYIDFPISISSTSNLNEIAIYPNPNNGYFTIEMVSSNDDLVQYKVINDLGEVLEKNVIHRTQGKFIKNMKFEKLSAGIYYINFIDKTGSKIMKLIIK